MVSYLLLCALAIFGVQIGESQNLKECYNCNARLFGGCYFTNSYSVVCADDTQQCGNMTFTTGASTFFTRYGCFTADNCNKTNVVGAGAFRFLTYNSTCCSTSFCNGAFAANAPHLVILATLCSVILYVVS